MHLIFIHSAMLKLILSVLIFLNILEKYSACTKIDFNVENSSEELQQFWKSTGFSPPQNDAAEFLSSEDERINIALIGSTPNKGIEFVRIHWLINLIRFENGSYNYTKLDNLLDWIHQQKLFLGFELMGKPENLPQDYIKDIYQFWFDLVSNIAKRYINRYGIKVVKKWRFETWNEPDLKSYNIFNFTLEEYIKYVTACSDGLAVALINTPTNKSINVSSSFTNRNILKLGGPAGLFKEHDKHPLCWGLLEMCNSRSDGACPLHYVSFHKKGDGSAGQVLAKGLELLKEIHKQFPNIKHLPFANDEADILTNWSKDEEWRGDARYAAMVVKVIIDHFKEIIHRRKLKLELLSNDNGFLNYYPYYFTQRTLFARFQMNNTHPRHIQFVRKPVHTVMGLLSFLRGRYIKGKIHSSGTLISFLGARSRNNENQSESFTVIIAYGDDSGVGIKPTKKFNISFLNLPRKNCKYVIYLIDNNLTNPFLVWKNFNSPDYPKKELLKKMRDVQEPFRLDGPISINKTGILSVFVELELPSILLVNICERSKISPGPVTHLQVLNVTKNEALLIWKDNKVHSKCILTYEIEFAPSCGNKSNTFQRINKNDLIFLSYHFMAEESSGCDAAKGRYRVRAIDYWYRKGKYSKIIHYNENTKHNL